MGVNEPCSISIVMGYIRSQGIHVPRRRIKESLHRVDPAGIEERRLTTIRQREYNVDAPNDVWHMDGHHKLIRCKLCCQLSQLLLLGST